MDALASQGKQAGSLWLAGFREACSLHRVLIFCFRSKMLSIRTGQCFLLNGFIFLGSLFTLKSAVIPTLLWILPDQCEKLGPQHLCNQKEALALYSFLRFILIQIFYIFWFYPLYVFSFILSTLWYNDIAKYAFAVLTKEGPSKEQTPNRKDLSDSQSFRQMSRPGGFERVFLGIGEQVYSILLLSIFFIEVQWKSLCSSDSLFLHTCELWNYGYTLSNVLQFVLTAAGTQVEQVIDSLTSSWGGGGPRKLRIFYAADKVSMLVLQLFPEVQKGH
ncbi:protein EI24 homolog isoform X3 [Elaeis guineensis]|uniref:Protein EI24 homolog isoform X3 n=1 Tax=Elaeis guineensis var. tenera TaxID=51953 RepID=A0A6J0PE27_ELAGV|nr:protein EI24 homolog isoform X3 [Elaeis guineensis]